MINCLVNSGRPLSSEVAELLYCKAREMARHRKKKLKVKSNGCVGVILTQWKTSHIGAIAGLQFTAELAIGSGETTVTYIVRTFDLDDPDDGKWHGMSSAEERDEFIRKDAMKERPARLN